MGIANVGLEFGDHRETDIDGHRTTCWDVKKHTFYVRVYMYPIPILTLKTHTSGFAVGLLVIGAIFQCNERNLRDVSDRILAYLNSNDQRSVCIAVVSFCDEGMAQNSTVGTVFFFFFRIAYKFNTC